MLTGSRVLIRGLVLLAMLLALPCSFVVQAVAGVPPSEPGSCQTVATEDGWYYACWVSNNAADPDRISDFSTGIQTVLTYNDESDDNPGGIDGYYGSNSYNGVTEFQQNHGLTVDGIVGTYTWNYLQQDIDYVTTSGSYHYYKVENSSPSRFRLYTTNHYWYVKNSAGVWVLMDRTRT